MMMMIIAQNEAVSLGVGWQIAIILWCKFSFGKAFGTSLSSTVLMTVKISNCESGHTSQCDHCFQQKEASLLTQLVCVHTFDPIALESQLPIPGLFFLVVVVDYKEESPCQGKKTLSRDRVMWRRWDIDMREAREAWQTHMIRCMRLLCSWFGIWSCIQNETSLVPDNYSSWTPPEWVKNIQIERVVETQLIRRRWRGDDMREGSPKPKGGCKRKTRGQWFSSRLTLKEWLELSSQSRKTDCKSKRDREGFLPWKEEGAYDSIVIPKRLSSFPSFTILHSLEQP